jgi:hypothetical protein
MILNEIKKAKYFPLENYDWPVLRVQVSLDEPKFFTGVDDIVNYAFKNGLCLSKVEYLKYDAWS